MDFHTLLGMAKENAGKKTTKSTYSTEVSKPRKVTPKEKQLSASVKAFLDKQQQEEKKQKIIAAQKKEKLLEMRRENTKSNRVMKSMLNMTKSANKSALPEARNSRDTADTLAGRRQCDEDDYGYESTSARSFYDKLMAKYENAPEDPRAKFATKKSSGDINKTMARVKEALDKNDEDNHVRVRASSSRNRERESSPPTSSSKSEADKKSRRQQEEEARKRRMAKSKAVAPPSFEELMKMAQEKQKEPVKNAAKPAALQEAEFGRPMTKKQKEEYMREKASQLRKSGKASTSPDSGGSKGSKPAEDPKTSSKASEAKAKPEEPEKAAVPEVKKRPVITGPEFHPAVVKQKPRSSPEQRPPVAKDRNENPVAGSSKSSNGLKRPLSSDAKRISKPPAAQDVKAKVTVAGQGFLRKQKSNRIESDYEDEEDEDEYDDMDDFIDDSDAKIDISAEIRNIFGYDRRKFADEDDFDDRSMENNRYSALMKEEARSAKIGRMEDLEDMRKEEEEKRRKKMKLKRR